METKEIDIFDSNKFQIRKYKYNIPDTKAYLILGKTMFGKTTLIKSSGYQMFCSDDFFDNLLEIQHISATLTNGSKTSAFGTYDKVISFDPITSSSIIISFLICEFRSELMGFKE